MLLEKQILKETQFKRNNLKSYYKAFFKVLLLQPL